MKIECYVFFNSLPFIFSIKPKYWKYLCIGYRYVWNENEWGLSIHPGKWRYTYLSKCIKKHIITPPKLLFVFHSWFLNFHIWHAYQPRNNNVHVPQQNFNNIQKFIHENLNSTKFSICTYGVPTFMSFVCFFPMFLFFGAILSS